MCESCNDLTHTDGPAEPARRKFLVAGAGLAAAPFITGLATPAAAQEGSEVGKSGPFQTRAYGTTSAKSPVVPMQIQRRAVGPMDVLVDVQYCGVCHSDVHQARDEWQGIMTTQWPCVPGHEMVGRVAAIGANVTKFKVGDSCGVGCMVDSCGECENCLADLEQHCLRGALYTYNVPDPHLGGHTLGGFSERIVVPEKFVIRIPPGVDQAAFAPLLCAGLTTFSPIQRWQVDTGRRIGVLGLGGLGHMAVKLAVAKGAEVTVITTSSGKVKDARRLGASEAVLSTDQAAMEKLAGRFDVLLATIPQAFSVQPYVPLLKTGGTLVNLGSMHNLEDVNGAALTFARKHISGSLIGGLAETQQVIDFCAARNIKADIELIRPDQLTEAFERVKGKDVRYRFVVDMQQA